MPQYSEETRSDSARPSPGRAAHHPVVLVIDPSETTRSVLEVSMSRDGFAVMSAATSQHALELARRRRPDVVVVESDLGGEDGFSLVAQLRGDGRLGRVPVLLLARPEDRDVQALAEVVGIDAFLHKPAYARDVIALVRLEYLRRSGAEDIVFDTAQLPPAHLLRTLLATSRSGQLTLADGHAHVAFSRGRIVNVGFDDPHGDIDALVRALALTTRTYSLRLGPVEGTPTLRCGLRELVTMVMPRLMKFSQVQARSVPLDARMVVNFRKLGATLQSLPDGVNGVIQLFDGYRTLLDVLTDSPVNETVTLELSTRLFLMGVLTTSVPMPENPGKTPRLFEPQPDEAKALLHELFDGGVEMSATRAETPSTDWFEEPRGTGLEVAEPSGGWLAGPGPEVMKDLPAELQQQLAAFNIELEAERPEVSAETRAVGEFARDGATDERDSIEGAISSMVAADAPLRLSNPVAREAPPAESLDPVPEPVLRLKYGEDGVITPVLTPAVDAATALEETFFEPSTSEPAAEAAVPAPAPEKKSKASRVSLWALLVLGVIVLAVGVEVVVQRTRQPEPAPAVLVPSPAPVPASPAVAPAVAEAAEAPAEEPPPPEVLDVRDNIAEAKRAYEAGEYAKAAAVLEQTLLDAPKSTDAWMLLGLVRYDSRDSAGARSAAAKVLEIEPSNARVHILLASLAFDEGDREKGKAALQRYLDLEPEGQHANEARALLKR